MRTKSCPKAHQNTLLLASLYQLCKVTLEISHPPIIKPTPQSLLLTPISIKNFPSPPLQPFLRIMKEGGGGRRTMKMLDKKFVSLVEEAEKKKDINEKKTLRRKMD